MRHTLDPKDITSLNKGGAFRVILGGLEGAVPSMLVNRQNGSILALERARGRNMQEINIVRYKGYDPTEGTVEEREEVLTFEKGELGYKVLDSRLNGAKL